MEAKTKLAISISSETPKIKMGGKKLMNHIFKNSLKPGKLSYKR